MSKLIVKKNKAISLLSRRIKSKTLLMRGGSNSPHIAGGLGLIDTLKDNTIVKMFILNNQIINDDAAIKIAEALKTNKTLTTLTIDKNSKISDIGIIKILDSLKTNNTLRVLNILNKNLTEDKYPAIITALKDTLRINTRLSYFFTSIKISIDEQEEIAKIIKCNINLSGLSIPNKSVELQKVLTENGDITRSIEKEIKIGTTITQCLKLIKKEYPSRFTDTDTDTVCLNKFITAFFTNETNNLIKEKKTIHNRYAILPPIPRKPTNNTSIIPTNATRNINSSRIILQPLNNITKRQHTKPTPPQYPKQSTYSRKPRGASVVLPL